MLLSLVPDFAGYLVPGSDLPLNSAGHCSLPYQDKPEPFVSKENGPGPAHQNMPNRAHPPQTKTMPDETIVASFQRIPEQENSPTQRQVPSFIQAILKSKRHFKDYC